MGISFRANIRPSINTNNPLDACQLNPTFVQVSTKYDNNKTILCFTKLHHPIYSQILVLLPFPSYPTSFEQH